MFKYWKIAREQVKKMKEEDKAKQRMLEANMDYAYLEELIQKINDNPMLHIKVTLKDGTTLDLDTTPKTDNSNITYGQPHTAFIEVK